VRTSCSLRTGVDHLRARCPRYRFVRAKRKPAPREGIRVTGLPAAPRTASGADYHDRERRCREQGARRRETCDPAVAELVEGVAPKRSTDPSLADVPASIRVSATAM
jgi:hypothetical protein